VPLKVLVSMMSAPASMKARWISSITSGCVIESRSLLPCRGLTVVGEGLPAVGLLVETIALDHRAHRAVEDRDALG
jgi:hypothetical protein